MKKSLSLIFLPLIFVSSCKDSKSIPLKSALATNVSSEELTASELAAAQGIAWWDIILPEVSPDRVKIYFEIEFFDGTKTRTGSTEFNKQNNQNKLKAFCRTNEQGHLEVSFVFNDGEASMLGRFDDNPFSTAKLSSPSSGAVKVGNFLYKGTYEKTVTSGQTLEEGEFGLRIVMEPSKMQHKSQ